MDAALGRALTVTPHGDIIQPALETIGICSVDAVIAVGAENGDAFADTIISFIPAIDATQAVRDKVSAILEQRRESLAALWRIATGGSKLFDEVTLKQTMFAGDTLGGRTAVFNSPISRKAALKLKFDPRFANALVEHRKAAATGSLREQELKIKAKMVNRLLAIAHRAGDFSAATSQFDGDDWASLKEIDKQALIEALWLPEQLARSTATPENGRRSTLGRSQTGTTSTQ